MPELDSKTKDIEPAVIQLRSAAILLPKLLCGYFALQFGLAGLFFGLPGVLIGALSGLVLGYLIASILVPVFTWMIHVLFLLHGFRGRTDEESAESRRT